MPALLADLPSPLTLGLLTALLYLIAAVIFIITSRHKTSVMSVLVFSFLSSMGVSGAFRDLGDYTGATILTYLGVFAVFTGTCFMLQVPIARLPQPVRSQTLYGCLVASWLLLAWMMITPLGRELLPQITDWYIIIISGGGIGLYLLWIGLRSKTAWVRVKATGSGLGIVSCCIAAYVASALQAPLLVVSALRAAAPIIILVAIFLGRSLQHRASALPRA